MLFVFDRIGFEGVVRKRRSSVLKSGRTSFVAMADSAGESILAKRAELGAKTHRYSYVPTKMLKLQLCCYSSK